MKRKVTIGIVLIIAGIMLLFYSFMNHAADYIGVHKARSVNNAKAIDDNIDELISDYKDVLIF